MSATQVTDGRMRDIHVNCQVGDFRDPYRFAQGGYHLTLLAPGVLVYNASMLTPDSLLSSDVAHLHRPLAIDGPQESAGQRGGG